MRVGVRGMRGEGRESARGRMAIKEDLKVRRVSGVRRRVCGVGSAVLGARVEGIARGGV